jgi:hypothetical protein
MSVNGSKRRKPKGLRINIHKQSALRAWAKYWNCSQQDILEAVKTSGIMVEDVHDWVKRNVVRRVLLTR